MASNNEDVSNLPEDVAKSALRKRNQPRSAREIGLTALKNLPATITMIQGFMKVVDWKAAQTDVLRDLNNNVVIVGQPNTGKSTLFNKIKGQVLSAVAPEAGTTRSLVRTDFGPFTLIDTPGIEAPGKLSDIAQSGMEQASVIIFLMDASTGLQKKDRDLYEAVKKLKKPIIIAINKVDTLKRGENADQIATEAALMLGAAGVIPISAKTGQNIAEELIPAMIEASPEAALVIGRELPAFRRKAAQRIIRNATLMSLAAGIEPVPFIDIPILLGTQVHLVLRIAALYGEPMSSTEAMKHARELIATLAGGLGFRYLAEQAAKLVPFGGDFVAGAVAAAATWSIGEVAVEYYEGGKQLNTKRLQQIYQDVFRRFRRERNIEELKQDLEHGALNGNEPLKLLDEPERA